MAAPIRTDRSIQLFIWEGTLAGILSGFVEVYAAAYCLLLKASLLQIALLASLPLLAGSFFQLKAPNLIQKTGSRKRVLRLSVYAHSFISFAMAFAFLFGEKFGASFLIFGFCLFSITGQMAHVAWASWVGDIVPQDKTGSFFGQRTRFNHMAMFVATLIGGVFLNWMEKRWALPQIGFCLVFLAGGFSRLVCLPLIEKIQEPSLISSLQDKTIIFTIFLKKIFSHSFGRFVFYSGMITFAIFLAHPFIAPYLLEDLKLDYFVYSLLFATVVISKFAFYPIWGRLSDHHGVKRVLVASSLLFSIAPLLWLFSNHLIYLFLVQAYRACVWAGFEVVSFKFLVDATTSQNRPHFVSYYNALSGLLGVGGSLVGSWVVQNQIFSSPYFLVFIIAAVVQLMTSALFLPILKIPHVKALETFKASWPMAGAAVRPGESVPKT